MYICAFLCKVTGLPQNVESARREIEQHIYQRTGNMPITDPSSVSLGAYDIQGNLSGAAAAAVVARTTSSSSYGALAHHHNHQQSTQATVCRRGSAIDPSVNGGICFDDFHRNGNDVTYTGGAPMVSRRFFL